MGLTRERVDRPHRGRPDEPEQACSSPPPGHVARSAGQRGLYRTTDAGKTWELVLAPTTRDDRRDRRRDQPEEPADRLRGDVGSQAHQRHAHLRRHRLRPVPLQRRRRRRGSGWRRWAPARLPTYDQTQTGLKADASLGRIGVAVAPSNPDRVYVVFGSPVRPGQGLLLLQQRRRHLVHDRRHTECPTVAGRVSPAAATSGGSAASGSTRTTRTTSSTPTSPCARRPTAARPGRQQRQRARRPARHGLGPGVAGRQPGDAEQGLPRQRRRHLPLRRQRRQRHVGEVQQPAVEPGLPPRGLQAAPEPPRAGPAGQRLRQDLGPAERRPGPDRSGAAQLDRRGRRRRSSERDRPDRRQRLLHVLAVLGRRLAQLRPAHRQRDRDDDRQRRAGRRRRHQPLHDRRADRHRPERPAQERRRHPAAERALHGRRDHRPLAQPRHVDDGDLPDAAAAGQLHRPGPVAARARAGERGRHRALHEPLRRGDGAGPGEVGHAGPLRAGDLRGHGHRQGVEDDRRRARPGSGCRACPSAG